MIGRWRSRGVLVGTVGRFARRSPATETATPAERSPRRTVRMGSGSAEGPVSGGVAAPGCPRRDPPAGKGSPMAIAVDLANGVSPRRRNWPCWRSAKTGFRDQRRLDFGGGVFLRAVGLAAPWLGVGGRGGEGLVFA